MLFSTALEDAAAPGAFDQASAEVRARVETFARRATAFRSLLPGDDAPPGPVRWTLEKRRRLERDLFAFIDEPDIAGVAANYAADAVIFYEWEGMAEGPLQEASHVERYLVEHPETALRSYLVLFLAHRYRCVHEVYTSSGDAPGAADIWPRYRAWLEEAERAADPLTRFLSRDLDARPYLYLEGAPAGFADPDDFPPCPETATQDPIPDPEEWALRCFVLSSGPDVGGPETIRKTWADIDGDGTPELLIGSTVARGNAGGVHFIFRRQGDAFRYLGALFLHPDAWRPLAPADDGRPRLLRYVRLGAGDGLLETVAYDGTAFVTESSESVSPLERDRERLCRLLGIMCAGDASESASGLTAREALDAAEEYVKRTGVDLSAQRLHSVTLRYDETERVEYWHLQWMWTRPRLGGEFSLRVYLDGRAVEARLGP